MAMQSAFLDKFQELTKEFSQPRKYIQLTGHDLTIATLYQIWKRDDIMLTLADHCWEVMKKNSEFLHSEIAKGRVIYGVNTGYGGSADVRSCDTKELQLSLIRHLNAGFGDVLPPKLVKITMAIRANSLCRGYSGVRPEVVKLLIDMVNNDIIPVVPKRGSVSASGDLMPTSYIAACMIGREDAKCTYNGKQMTAPEALKSASLEPIVFEAKEALAVLNSSSFSAALGSCVLYEAGLAITLTQIATAMTVEAMNGQIDSFHPTIQHCMGHPGQIEVAANIRTFLEDSKFVTCHEQYNRDPNGVLKQDRYALRTSPQWLAPTVETLVTSINRVTVEINSSNDNPLFDHVQGEILHCGNFQGISVTVAMDQTRQSLQLCGKLLFAQLQEMTNVNLNFGLTPNLAGSDISVDFGFKGMDTAMASYMSELDYLTNSLTNHVLSAELHNQAVNSMALVSARYTREALEILQMMISNILLVHVQAIDLRWLKSQVEKEIDVIRHMFNIEAVHFNPKLRPWYLVLFAPQREGDKILEEKETNGINGEVFISEMCERMATMREQMEGDSYMADVEEHLGKGTRELYRQIRRNLGVKFNYGQEAPDKALESIYNYVKSEDVAGLLCQILKSD